MADLIFNLPVGSATRFLTANKYCDKNIAVYVEPGNTDFDDETVAIAIAVIEDRAITQLPNELTCIAPNTFRNHTGLSGLTRLPDSITFIGDFAFGNSNVALTKLPSSLKTINTQAFYGCENLNIASIPDGVESIKSQAFNYASLSTLTVPASVTNIESGAFSNSNLTEIFFLGKPSNLERCLNGNSNLVIHCAWGEGEVAGAPWGATNATIEYNYTP